jgi:hypothetical protein
MGRLSRCDDQGSQDNAQNQETNHEQGEAGEE